MMLWFLAVIVVFGGLEICGMPGRYFINPTCSPTRGDICIEIRKCPYFTQLLDKSTIPRPRHVIRKIREKQCGFHGNVPKVCCDKPAVSTPFVDVDMPMKYEDPPDVVGHKNLELLPEDLCGHISNEFRITSGTQTTMDEFPWMALIAYRTDDGLDFKCGGTLVNDRYVLTAAHCVVNSQVVGVRLGEHNIVTDNDCDSLKGVCSSVQDFYIEDIIVHHEYDFKTLTNDIALIRLATPANFTYENVRPICLPIGENARINLNGKFAVVSGWGVTEHGYKSAELLKISIPVVPYESCQRLYKKHTKISHKQICAGGYLGRDSCGGDSGGPLKFVGKIKHTTRYIQYGIVSYGPRYCGAEGQPGIYTNVPYYMEWILDNLKPSDDDVV